MRLEGTLTKWNDERGFGFITPDQGGPEVFVHVSTFPKDGLRPTVGEKLTFEVETDREGKKRAINLLCPNRPAHRPARRPSSHPRNGTNSFIRQVITVVVIFALAYYGYMEYSRRAAPRIPATTQASEQFTPSQFQCDGRTYCSQMTSCEEATYFLQHCPNVEMDGNHDGVPCEQQWCN